VVAVPAVSVAAILPAVLGRRHVGAAVVRTFQQTHVVGALAHRGLNDQARTNIQGRLRILGLLESAARLRHDARIGIGEVDLSGFANRQIAIAALM
jgi:hypothetical protein